jgi:uncharacterized protein
MSDDLAQRVAAFLAAHHVLSLATSSPAGPHAANLFYACDGFALVWVSEENARHSREIEADPRVAATIAPQYTDFALIRGLQIAGTARKIAAQEKARQLALLEARYPFLQRLADAPAELRAAYARVAVYRLEPAHITLIDNTKGFGHKETLDLSLPQA